MQIKTYFFVAILHYLRAYPFLKCIHVDKLAAEMVDYETERTQHTAEAF